LLALLAGCNQSTTEPTPIEEPLEEQSSALGAASNNGESSSPGTFSGSLATFPGLRSFAAGEGIAGEIVAQRAATVTLKVMTTAPNGTTATKTLGTYAMSANEKRPYQLSPDDVLVRSHGGVSEVRVLAEYRDRGEAPISVMVGAPVLVTYGSDFASAIAMSSPPAPADAMPLHVAALKLRYEAKKRGITSVAARASASTTVAEPALATAASRVQFASDAANETRSFLANPTANRALADQLLAAPNDVLVQVSDARGKRIESGAGGGAMFPKETYDTLFPASTASAPQAASASLLPNSTIRVCISITPHYRDALQTDAILGTPMNLNVAVPAARVGISGTVGNSATLPGATLDDNGCISGTYFGGSSTWSYNLTLDYGRGGKGNFMWAIAPAGAYLVGFSGNGSFGSSTSVTVNRTDFANSNAVNAVGVFSRVAVMPDNGFYNNFSTATNPNGNQINLDPINGCQPYTNGEPGMSDACGDEFSVVLGKNRNQATGGSGVGHTSESKYVVAHEIGHTQQARTTGLTPRSGIGNYFEVNGAPKTGDTDYPAQPDICKCDHVTNANRTHCFQSRHSVSSISNEGWGHFFATKALNANPASSAMFRYYKDIKLAWGWPFNPVYSPPIAFDVNAGTLPPVNSLSAPEPAAKWRNNNCGKTNRATEGDWMRFLTRLHFIGNDKLTVQEIANIYLRACGDNTGTPRKCDIGPAVGQFATPIHWQTNDGAATQRSLNNAASGQLGNGSMKQLNWLARATEAGVSDNLTP
jgi:hypothetical protein